MNKVIKNIKSDKFKVEPNDWTVTIEKKKSTEGTKSVGKVKEMDKHRQNLIEILLNTNATPIRTFDGLGYTCSFCLCSSFPDIRDLKKHTLEKHDDSDKKKIMFNHPIAGYFVKLDVTSFKCVICGKDIQTIEEMMKHLTTEHNRTLHTDIKNRMLPFNFVEGLFECVICRKKIEHLKVMQEHLNVHYGSFFCDECSAPFITQRSLKCHEKRHKQGEFPCTVCSKVFDTIPRRDDHAKAVHDGTNKRNKCPICFEKFLSHYKKQKHMTREHGMEQTFYKCMACEKSFACKSRLNKHRRRDHLMERCHECQECEKKFFALKDLKQHMLSHTGVKEFQCDVCLKSYGRKSTLREHMRIHKDDRRFKCEHCEQAFVQKCSWKGHMRSKHGIIVSNS